MNGMRTDCENFTSFDYERLSQQRRHADSKPALAGQPHGVEQDSEGQERKQTVAKT